MTPERDPELGGSLERALPSPTPRYGQKERVRRSLDERFARERRKIALWPLALAATIAVVLASALWKRPTATTVVSARSSLLTLTTASIAVRSDAQLAVERDDRSGTLVRLSSGTILVHVEKGTGRPFAVLAGSVRVDVIGTFFAVSLRTGATSIDVFEGVVRVTDAAGAHLARAGERYPAGADPVSPTNEEVALLSASFGSRVAQAASASPGAAPSVEPSVEPGAGSPTAAASARVPSRTTPDAYASAKDLERSGATDAALEIYAKIANAGGRNREDALLSCGLSRRPRQRPARLQVPSRSRHGAGTTRELQGRPRGNRGRPAEPGEASRARRLSLDSSLSGPGRPQALDGAPQRTSQRPLQRRRHG